MNVTILSDLQSSKHIKDYFVVPLNEKSVDPCYKIEYAQNQIRIRSYEQFPDNKEFCYPTQQRDIDIKI